MVNDEGVIGVSAVEVVGARADADRVKMLCQLASGLWSHKLIGHEQRLSLIRPLIGMTARIAANPDVRESIVAPFGVPP